MFEDLIDPLIKCISSVLLEHCVQDDEAIHSFNNYNKYQHEIFLIFQPRSIVSKEEDCP